MEVTKAIIGGLGGGRVEGCNLRLRSKRPKHWKENQVMMPLEVGNVCVAHAICRVSIKYLIF
jgi:hypothetical protein